MGAVAFALEYLGDDYIVMNGDLLTTLNYGDLFAQHLERRAAATIAIFRREIRIEFGVIESGPSQELLGYREKPVFSFDLGMGVNVLNRNVASRFLEKNVYLDLPDLMMRIRDSGEPVYCYR